MPSKRTNETKPKRKNADARLLQLAQKFIDGVLDDLAIQESRVGLLARKALRFKRNGEPLDDGDSDKVLILLKAISEGYNKALKENLFRKDRRTGTMMFDYKIPDELAEPEPDPASGEAQSARPDLAALLGRIVALTHEDDLKAIKAAVDCLELGRGCSTPAEDFVETVLYYYAINSFITPENISRAVEKFREDYADLAENGTRFVHHHERMIQAARAGRNSDKPAA
jgi:hypothetical protein